MEATEGRVKGAIRTLYPGYFALIMATGIISNGFYLLDIKAISNALLVVDSAAFVVLIPATIARAIMFPRLLWAELRSAAKGTVSIHRFRAGKDGTIALWLADGQNTAAPEIRLPLENVLVSSGFGMRADPFDQLRMHRIE